MRERVAQFIAGVRVEDMRDLGSTMTSDWRSPSAEAGDAESEGAVICEAARAECVWRSAAVAIMTCGSDVRPGSSACVTVTISAAHSSDQVTDGHASPPKLLYMYQLLPPHTN